MRNALTLLIQHPNLATTIPADWPALTLAGGELFMEVLHILRDSPDLQTAALVERFRDHPHTAHINNFAGLSHAAPLEGVEAEFSDSLEKIKKMQRSKQIENLMARAAVAPGLSPEERQTLQSLIKTQNPAKTD
jgi:DNA primase